MIKRGTICHICSSPDAVRFGSSVLQRLLQAMAFLAILSAPLIYAYGLLLIIGGTIVYALSRVRLLLVNVWLLLTTGQPLDILSGLDATAQYSSSTYFSQPECPKVITSTLVLQGRMEVAALQQHYLKHVVKARDPATGRLVNPRWTQRVERRFGFFVWTKNGPFDIRTHIRAHDEVYADDVALIKMIERIYLKPLPPARPPWELLVIPKMATAGADEQCALVYRVHHSLADGVNLVAVLNALACGAPDEKVKESDKLTSGEKLPNLVKRNPLLLFLANPGQKWTVSAAADIIWNVLSIAFAAPWLVAQLVMQKPGRNSLHGPDLSGRKLLAVSNDIQFLILKDIASAFNCCINDVFHYGITGAIQKCNEESPESPTEKYVTLLVPMYMIRPNASWTQNGFTFSFVRYPLQGESPQSRLRDIAAVTDAVKSSAEPLLNFVITQVMSNHMPVALAKRCLAPSFDFTAIATNIIGPSSDISILGLSVTNLFFFPINHSRSGVSISMFSLKDCVRLGITVDRAVAPDDGIAQRLANHFESEVQILHQLVQEQGRKPLSNFCPAF